MQNKSYLKLLTPPDSLPITLDQLKAHLGITGSSDDLRLSLLLGAAIDHIEAETGNSYSQNEFMIVLDGFPTYSNWMNRNILYVQDYPYYGLANKREIYLPKPPVIPTSVSVQYYDVDNTLQTWDDSLYYVQYPETQRAWITPVEDYPATYDRPDSVQITYVTSADTIPWRLVPAVLATCAMWNENREGQWDWTGIDRVIDNLKGGRYV